MPATWSPSTLAVASSFAFAAKRPRRFELGSRSAYSLVPRRVSFLSEGVQRRQFVVATADYFTREPNLLSFRKGDRIELLTPDDDQPQPVGWLFGRIDNRYGNLPEDYIATEDRDERVVSALSTCRRSVAALLSTFFQAN